MYRQTDGRTDCWERHINWNEIGELNPSGRKRLEQEEKEEEEKSGSVSFVFATYFSLLPIELFFGKLVEILEHNSQGIFRDVRRLPGKEVD